MTEPVQQLGDLVSQSRWDAAIELLRRQSLEQAADAILDLPFEQQRRLFRHLPADLSAG